MMVEGRGLAQDLRGGLEVVFEGETGQGAAVLREWFALIAQDLARPELNLLTSRNGGQSFQPAGFASDAADPAILGERRARCFARRFMSGQGCTGHACLPHSPVAHPPHNRYRAHSPWLSQQ